MGTMQIGTPAGATGDGKGLTPEQLASPPPVTPQNVPTTYGDNHVPAAKRNKTLIIVISIVAGFFAIAGIILAIVLINGNKQLSCELNDSAGNITNHVEFNINFVFYRVDNAHIYQKITLPTKVSNLYVEQYRKALEAQDTENDFADLKVYSDGDRSIIAEGTAKVNRLTRRGKSIDEVKDLMKDEGYTCKEK